MCRFIVVCDVLTKSKRNKCFTFPSLRLWSIMTGLRNTRSCVCWIPYNRGGWPSGPRGSVAWQVWIKQKSKTGVQNIFQNSSSKLKIPGARKVTRNNFHTVGPHLLSITNSVITTTRRPSFMHPWCKIHFFTTKAAIQKVDPSATASETYSGNVWFEPHTGERLPFLRFSLSSVHHSQYRNSTAITSTAFLIHSSLIVPTSGANPSEIQRR